MEYIKGIDGFRGLLVLVISIFHTFTIFFPDKVDYFPGGFLGVESFFVLSGYLITKTLYRSFDVHHNYLEAILSYIRRRFLRVFPSLLFVVITVYLSVVYLKISATNHILEESISGLSFLYNYYLIFRELPYFQKFEEINFFLHLWSLSIEFQLYTLLGFIFLILNLIAKDNNLLKATTLFFIAVISILTNYYYFNVESLGIDRIYFSTEARSFGFFLGALVAIFEGKIKDILGELSGYLLGVLGLVGLLISFMYLSIYTEFCYPFGFLVADLFSIMVLLGFLTSLYYRESIGILDWFGRRSYPFYLWHYPVFSIINILYGSNPILIAFGFILVLSISDLTHRLVEEPFRKLSFRIKLVPLSFSAIVFIGLLAVLFNLKTLNLYNHQQVYSQRKDLDKPINFTADNLEEKTATEDKPTSNSSKDDKTKDDKKKVEEIQSVNPEGGGGKIFMIGDSVLLGASNYIKKILPDVSIDAKVGRQASEVFEVIDKYRESIDKSDAVVIHIGNNGFVKKDILEGIVERIGKDKRIYFLTVNAPLPWKDRVNANIRSIGRYENVKVIEWDKFDNPEFFVKDRVHLSSKGIVKYASLIGSDLGFKISVSKESKPKLENYQKDQKTPPELDEERVKQDGEDHSSGYIIKAINEVK